MSNKKFMLRNKSIKDRLRVDLLKPTSLPEECYQFRTPNNEELKDAGVIFREDNLDNSDILYVAEGKRQYGRAYIVSNTGEYRELTPDEWLKVTAALMSDLGIDVSKI